MKDLTRSKTWMAWAEGFESRAGAPFDLFGAAESFALGLSPGSSGAAAAATREMARLARGI